MCPKQDMHWKEAPVECPRVGLQEVAGEALGRGGLLCRDVLGTLTLARTGPPVTTILAGLTPNFAWV